jgi:tRNA dimethylallyltransferase
VGAFTPDCRKKSETAEQSFLPLEKKTKIINPLKNEKVLLIAGPTACGKTALSVHLAEMLKGEVISCDSMQVYRGMDIGTAKVTKEQQERVPHHLIDIRDVYEPFNVVDFFYEATQCVDSILARGKVPILVGGTGFYFRAFLYGPPNGPPSVPEVRHALEEEMRARGGQALYDELMAKDPEYGRTITPNDKHKIIRALEIISLSGGKVSSIEWQQSRLRPGYQYNAWFIHRPRAKLYEDIEARCDKMMDAGFLEEARELEGKGLELNPSASQAIGYRQALDYFRSSQDNKAFGHFMREFKKASRHYAKRQFTWFKKQPLFEWLDVEKHDLEIAAEMIAHDFQSTIN